jgi:hypothetical protein
MNRYIIIIIVVFMILVACTPSPVSTVALPTNTIPARPTRTPPPTATAIVSPTVEVIDDAGHPGLPLPVVQGRLFSTSGECANCHTNMTDDGGADVSIDSEWRSTMMANASRDPYWQASVRGEVLTLPDLRSTIEENCTTCHMPMARYAAMDSGDEVLIFDNGFLNPENDSHTFAIDSVSCTLCHQIREEGLGFSSSYSGEFYIDTELRIPNRVIFGPFEIENALAETMQHVSGYRPEQGLHLGRSELCASCHTLYTPYVNYRGEIVGEFPEQVSYLEWFYSDYRRTRTCQDCHMPVVDGGVMISTMSSVLRSPFSRHVFVGGNTYVLELLKTFGEELQVTASGEQFETTSDYTLEQLETRSATIEFDEVRLAGSRLFADVVIKNLAGHKFPTGFPSRRVWIHLTVQDVNDQVIFESGAFNPDGSIVGNDNDADPQNVEQHYLTIVQPEQVQIYETILQDTENHVTTTLLLASRYRKDNRLLPSGFEKAAPYEDISVRGGAMEDEDFLGGGDQIQYVVDVGSVEGPLTVSVELLYQSIGYRWVENLSQHDALEISRFLSYYEAISNTPVIVSSASIEVGN